MSRRTIAEIVYTSLAQLLYNFRGLGEKNLKSRLQKWDAGSPIPFYNGIGRPAGLGWGWLQFTQGNHPLPGLGLPLPRPIFPPPSTHPPQPPTPAKLWQCYLTLPGLHGGRIRPPLVNTCPYSDPAHSGVGTNMLVTLLGWRKAHTPA